MTKTAVNNLSKSTELEKDFDFEKIEALETKEIDETIKRFKKINLLPFNSQKIYFKSDMWDFSSYKVTNVSESSFRFYFNRCPSQFKDILKVYGLYKILENKMKIQTVKKAHINLLINFFTYVSNLNCQTVYDITDKMITEFLNSRKVTARTNMKDRNAIKSFYQLYSIKFGDIRTKKIDKALENKDSRLIKAEIKQNKTEDIPKDYYRKYVHICKNIAKDTESDDLMRAVACVYLILSQTGLRIGECLNLTTDSLKEINYYKEEKNNYLVYETWKRVRGTHGVEHAYTYANDLTILGIEVLSNLESYKQIRKEQDINYLYLGSENTIRRKSFPVYRDTFTRHAQEFFVSIDNELTTVNLPDNYYPGILNKNNRLVNTKYHYVKTIAMPTTKQFRVRVVTDLISQGVHIKYVQMFMSHLSSEMTAHYATPKESYSKERDEVNLAKDTLERIITGEEKLLGESSNEFVEGIQSFIKENKFNVQKDLDTIIENLIEKYPIKQKAGGYLIAPPTIRRTTTDILSDKYYEKYGFETSGFTFYYMIDHTYKQAANLRKIVDYNLVNDYKKEAKVELTKLKNTVKDLLKPEFLELQNKIKQLSVNDILKDHPNLLEIIENMENIEKEINEWMTIEI